MNIMKHVRKNCFQISISVLLLVLWGCKSDDSANTTEHDGKNLNVNFVTPTALTGPLINDLQAYITLNGSRKALTVNPDNTISGTIQDVAPGQYELVIVYYVMASGMETHLATITKNITVTKGQTTRVQIADADLNRNIDDDFDGYTNLAEIRIGTNAHNKAELPGGVELPLYAVGNGSFGDVSSTGFESQAIVGEGLNGSTESTNFNVVAGFSNY